MLDLETLALTSSCRSFFCDPLVCLQLQIKRYSTNCHLSSASLPSFFHDVLNINAHSCISSKHHTLTIIVITATITLHSQITTPLILRVSNKMSLARFPGCTKEFIHLLHLGFTLLSTVGRLWLLTANFSYFSRGTLNRRR